MPDSDTQIAVLTGDLVNSTELGPENIDRAFKALEDCARTQEDWHSAPLHFTRHRGDGWQVVLAKPKMALRSALAFRATLRALGDEFDAYLSIATGAPPRELVPDLNTISAPVFVSSGQELEDLKRSPGPYRILHTPRGAYDAATILADAISQDWTAAQAAAMLPTLAPEFNLNYTGLGKQLGKSRQAVTKALEAGHYDHIKLALQTLEHGQ